jgi:hypothetical protein
VREPKDQVRREYRPIDSADDDLIVRGQIGPARPDHRPDDRRPLRRRGPVRSTIIAS